MILKNQPQKKKPHLPPAEEKPYAQEAKLVPKELDEPTSPAFGNQSTKGRNDLIPYAPSSISPGESYDIAYAHARETSQTNLLDVVEKEMIRRSLKESGGNQVKASAMLGITRATLRKRIDAYEIRY